VLISKPPAPTVVQRVLDRVARSHKPFTVCFLGAQGMSLPANARLAATLKAAAEAVVGSMATEGVVPPAPATRGKVVRGLFAGGTLCSEAQIVFRHAGLVVESNVPVPGAAAMTGASDAHILIDLGADEFTRGRPHPMIEPAARDRPLADALADAQTGVILLDIILGYGGHPDPAGHLADLLRGRAGEPRIVASVTGTDSDPQRRSEQVRKLAEAGVLVADSNADAAATAIAAIGASRTG
jgi:FdrA protein